MGTREGNFAAGNVMETTEKNSQETYSADNLMAYRVSLSLIDSLYSGGHLTAADRRKAYYGIKYKKVGEDHYTVGYSSYYLDYVIDWLNNCFDFAEENMGQESRCIHCMQGVVLRGVCTSCGKENIKFLKKGKNI